jgi:hypothetical protein
MGCSIVQVETLGVILSGKYSDFEITQQYGLLPPSFLPLSGRRLYASQIDYLSKFCARIFLTIPSDFELTPFDEEQLAGMKVRTIRSNPNISINDALLQVLSVVQSEGESIAVLYGDTLINEEIPINSVTIYKKPETYSWGRNKGISEYEISQDENIEMMMAGFFYLSDVKLLESAIHQSDGNILDTLDGYSQSLPLCYKKVQTWNDFGHIGTLQQSQLFFSESRFFNLVKITELGVSKQSTDLSKLNAEIVWYENLPTEFQKYVPKLISKSKNEYTIEYIPFPTLHDLLIHGNLSLTQWRRLFSQLRTFFLEAKEFSGRPNQIALESLLSAKTKARCEQFLTTSPNLKDFNLIDLRKILSEQNIDLLLSKIELENSRFSGVLHGDMCATNIFWDGISETLKTVDPRGDSSGISTGIHGDIRYDIAKLYQSFVLGYDFVLSGIGKGADAVENLNKISSLKYSKVDFEALFQTMLFDPLDIDQTEIAAISTLLMMGLLPLHADRVDRQNQFVHIIVDMLDRLDT